MKFKEGDRVVCVNDKASNQRLTLGEKYIVRKSTYTMRDEYVFIIRERDQADLALWYAHRFEKIKQFTINNQTKII